MEGAFPLLFAAVVGFGHAFEADHLVAVGNIVTRRDRLNLAMKDGIYWGLGHSSTIFVIGLIMIIGKATFLNHYFGYFEAIVGAMLIVLGLYRLWQYFREEQKAALVFEEDNHQLAYGVGLIHGLAGSGAMVLLVMSEIQGSLSSMIYLLIFGLGSVIGMLVAAGLFSLPFSKRISNNRRWQLGLVLLSSLLCIGYGGFVLVENLG
ncbi:MAG: urease accessory protein [Bacteroidota bacterium]